MYLAKLSMSNGGGGEIVRESFFNPMSQIIYVMKQLGYTVELDETKGKLVIPKNWVRKYGNDAAPLSGEAVFKVKNSSSETVFNIRAHFDWSHETVRDGRRVAKDDPKPLNR